jgi:FkbM family methyltransferase
VYACPCAWVAVCCLPACLPACLHVQAMNGVVNVELVQCALSNEVGTAQLRCHGTPELNTIQAGGGGAGGSSSSAGGGVVGVPMDTLDNYAAANGVDLQRVRFVKIDVEGAEAKVIAGGSSLFEAGSPMVLFGACTCSCVRACSLCLRSQSGVTRRGQQCRIVEC